MQVQLDRKGSDLSTVTLSGSCIIFPPHKPKLRRSSVVVARDDSTLISCLVFHILFFNPLGTHKNPLASWQHVKWVVCEECYKSKSLSQPYVLIYVDSDCRFAHDS